VGSLWNRSGTVERYADDLRAAGAQAFFFNGGTTTPLTVYQDSGEASAHPHPVVADANGRWPDVFIPYTLSFDVQVKSADDVQLTYSLEIPNPDPIELSVTIPAESQVGTGMIHAEMLNTTKAGYVRLNGRTIGNASSSGTERANADTSALFSYLWNNLIDGIAAVSGGRGGSAASDFAANKTIVLPNWQGTVPLGLDDMGAAAGGFLALGFDVGNATTAGSRTGINGITLISDNLPAHSHSGTTAAESAHTHGVSGTTASASNDHTHSGTTASNGAHIHGVTDPGHTHTHSAVTSVGGILDGSGGVGLASATINSAVTGISINSDGAHTHTFTSGGQSASHTHTLSFTSDAGSAHSHTFTTDTVGSSTAFNNLPRSVLVTWFIKL